MLYKEIAIGFLLAGFIAQLGHDFFSGPLKRPSTASAAT